MASLEAISLSEDDVSKCGEILVTSQADKWTFMCTYCQKATNDIGVFICHVRLDHLTNFNDFQQRKMVYSKQDADNFFPEKTDSNHFPNKQDDMLFPSVDKRNNESNLTEEETVPQLSSESVNVLSDKNCFPMDYSSMDVKEEYITPTDSDVIKEGTAEEFVQFIYKKNELCDSNVTTTHAETIVNDSDMSSVYSVNNDDDDVIIEDSPNFECNNVSRASNSKRKNENTRDMQHTCELCYFSFTFKSELDHHLRKIHNQNLPLKCKQCNKAFRSATGLKIHLKAHDDKNNIRCPICQAKHTKNYYVSHVLTHESDTCYPCQICGKIYKSNEERLIHWKIHANDMPFKCDFCYRRFRKQQYLTHHLKSHFQYDCQFCPTQFNAVECQKPPYACTACENLPDVKERLQN